MLTEDAPTNNAGDGNVSMPPTKKQRLYSDNPKNIMRRKRMKSFKEFIKRWSV